MQGKNKISGIVFKIVFLILLVNEIAFAQQAKRIVIVKSSDNSYFNQTIEKLINQVDQAIEFKVINASLISANRELIDDSELVIALGTQATVTITRQYPDKPIVSSYVTRQQWQALKPRGRKHIAVLLDQPLERYIAFVHYLLNTQSIGIINNTPLEPDRNQKNLLTKLGINFIQYQLQQPEDLLPKVRQLIQRKGVLLMLPNQEIYTHESLRGILLTAYRSRTPVISYSPAHVNSGALASIYSSPVDIGEHIGGLIKQFLSGELNYENSLRYAQNYSIKTNANVAHSLLLNLPDETTLRKQLEDITK